MSPYRDDLRVGERSAQLQCGRGAELELGGRRGAVRPDIVGPVRVYVKRIPKDRPLGDTQGEERAPNDGA